MASSLLLPRRSPPPSYQAPASMEAPNPYGNPLQPAVPIDPQKAAILGGGQIWNRKDGYDFAAPARARYEAELYNRGLAPDQLELQKQYFDMYEKQRNTMVSVDKRQQEREEARAEQKALTDSYMQALKNGYIDNESMSLPSWQVLTDEERSKVLTGQKRREQDDRLVDMYADYRNNGGLHTWQDFRDAPKEMRQRWVAESIDPARMTPEQLASEYDFTKYTDESVKEARERGDPALLVPKDVAWVGRTDPKLIDLTRDQRQRYTKQMTPIWEIQDAHAQLAVALSQGTGAGDIAGIFKFMKTLDPNSVVREGEFKLAQSMSGAWAQMQAILNQYQEGDVLSPKDRAQMASLSRQLVEATKDKAQTLRQTMEQVADRYTLDRDLLYDRSAYDYGAIPEFTPAAELSDREREANWIEQKWDKYFP